MTLAFLILFAISARAEIIGLGTINAATGIDIVYPDRSDILSCELTFLKPGTGVTNLVTVVTTNRLLQLADIPAEVPEGRIVVALRWLCLGGVKSGYRLATMDLYRTPPDAPIVKLTFISRSPDRQQRISRKDGAESRNDTGTIVSRNYNGSVKSGDSGNNSKTNDAPVRAWHGAMTPPVVKQSLTTELADAIAEHFRRPKPTDLPPLPPSTGGMQRAFWDQAKPVQEIKQEARDAMLQFYRQGGQKGRK